MFSLNIFNKINFVTKPDDSASPTGLKLLSESKKWHADGTYERLYDQVLALIPISNVEQQFQILWNEMSHVHSKNKNIGARGDKFIPTF